MRKIWPSEDNCIKQVRILHQPKQVRISHQPMQVQISHQPMRLWCEISSVLPTPHEIFSFVFFDVNSFLILVVSQSQVLLCKDYKRGGNHLSKQILYILHLVKFSSQGEIQGSLCFPFLSSIFSFSWKPNNLWGCFPKGWEAKPLVSWSEGS